MVSTLCSLYSIQSGGISIACDNITALQNSLHDHKSPNLSSAEHNLLYAIKYKDAQLPIDYHMHHVKGHQDETLQMTRLD